MWNVTEYGSSGTGDFEVKQQKQGNKLLPLADLSFTERLLTATWPAGSRRDADGNIPGLKLAGEVSVQINLERLSARQLVSLYLAIKNAMKNKLFQDEIRQLLKDEDYEDEANDVKTLLV